MLFAKNTDARPFKILIVEDNPEDLITYERLLKKHTDHAFEVSTAGTAAAGLDELRRSVFDAVLVDYQLPDSDGITLIEQIRNICPVKQPAVIMITGQGSEKTAVQAMKLGALDYLTKNAVTSSMFVQTILNAIERANLKEQIMQYREELERSHQALSDFTHTAAHDLKAPLRRITSYCQILQNEVAEKLNENERTHIDRMIVNADRMQGLITNLLYYAQVMQRKEEAEQIDLNVLIKDVLEDFDTTIHDTGATVNVERMPTMSLYPFRIRQLFANLISNAIKYAKPDVAPIIQVGVEQQENETLFYVKDNGRGIPESRQEDVFRDFRRLHAQEEIEGTGLGLSICSKVIAMHDGRFWLSSKEEEGTTFYFTLSNRTN